MALTKITSDILADEFNTTNTLTAGATVNVDFKNAEVFTLTPNANTTFNIQNPVVGITKIILVIYL